MKNRFLAVLGLGLTVLFSACSAEDVENMTAKAKDAAGSLNLDNFTPESAKEKVSEIMTDLTGKLGEIKDEASATSVVEKLKPMLQNLEQLKGFLADKMPDMSALKDAAANLTSKFSSNESIMKIVQPLLDQIKNLTN